MTAKRTVVVGAGAIGLACADSLVKRGREVVVLDRGQPGDACTRGNAGWITPSLSAPIPAPGLTWTSLKWMLSSGSPLYIAPTAVPGLARWLWRFWRHCNASDFERGLHAVAEMNRRTLPLFDQLTREGFEFELHREGLLFVFRDEGYMAATRADFDHLRRYGYPVPNPLSRAELTALEPALSDEVVAGFLVEAEYHVRPESLATGYAKRLEAAGVSVRAGVDVTGFRIANGRIAGVETNGGGEAADEVLIAAGAWTGQVIERLGTRIPVQAGKGYSITLDGRGAELRRPVYLGEARIGCSPFDGGLRFAGTMELSGVNTTLDRRRIAGIRHGIGQFLTVPIGPNEGTEWVGMRPLTPDGLPMLGRVPGFTNAFVATGHAMLGVTMAPVTGEMMADLMVGQLDESTLGAFAPGRFRW
ncbi:MAG: NAD(P)/FAD-dependent oxidoreductase [Gemmatimonadales bacterium]